MNSVLTKATILQGLLYVGGIDYLQQLLRPVRPDYRCVVFRAAGLALQPEEKRLIDLLYNKGIRMDVSIVKELKMELDTVRIDYSHMPAHSNWFMAPATGIDVAAEDGIWEVPVGSFQIDAMSRIAFLFRRLLAVKQRRGTGISRSARQGRWANLYTLLLANLRYVWRNPLFLLTCDTKGYTLDMLLAGFQQYIDRHQREEAFWVAMINHPKLMFEDQLDLLTSFVRKTREHYDITFLTCSQALQGRQGVSVGNPGS